MAACVLAILAATYIVSIQPTITEWHGDESMFISLARSIARGEGLREVWAPGRPLSSTSAPLPAYALSLVALMGAERIAWFKLPVAIVASLALFLLYRFARRRLSPLGAICVVTAFATSHTALHYGTACVSEFPYLALVLGVLLLFEGGAPAGEQTSTARWVALVAVATLAFFTRKIGISLALALGAALVVCHALRIPPQLSLLRIAVTIALLAGLILAWANFEATHVSDAEAYPFRHGFSRVNPYDPREGDRAIGDHFNRALDNARFYVPTVASMTFPWAREEPLLRWVLGGAILALAAIGFVRERRRNVLFLTYPIAYGGVLLLWAWYGERLLLQLLPFVLVSAAVGLAALAQRFLVAKGIAVALAIVVMGQGAVAVGRAWERAHAVHDGGVVPATPHIRDYLTMMETIRRIVPEDAVLVSMLPPQTHFLSGRRGYAFPYNARRLDDVWQYFDRHKVTHLLLDDRFDKADHIFRPLLERYGRVFEEVSTLGAFHLFKVTLPVRASPR